MIFILGEIYQLQGNIARDGQKRFKETWERFSSEQTIPALNKILLERTAPSETKGEI
jgi:hypothetical protein